MSKISKCTFASAQSASTRNFQIASPKSWWCCHDYRSQFAFHRGSTPQSRPCKCNKSGHGSTAVRGKTLGEKGLGKTKTYMPECPVSVDWHSKVPSEPTDQIFFRLVVAAASQLAILTPCHWCHTVIVRSQHKNQSKQRDQKLEKNLLIRVPGDRALVLVSF